MSIVFFDIDGTLAMGRAVPQSAADGIARLRANKGLAFICTGRPRSYAVTNFGAYADGFVCCNGRLAFRGDEALYEKALSPGQVREIMARLDEVGCGYAFFSDGTVRYGGAGKYRPIAEEVWGDALVDGVDPDGDPLFSLDVYFADAAHCKRISEALAGLCLVNPHGPHPSADITVLGADKGDAVRSVAGALGVPIEDVYAFGDGVNDVPMIVAAGHGIAMGNAVDELKARAEFVTSAISDDGVWNGLAHYGLV